ncbi:uncharacterized protein LOC142235745 [Haematobia irritans]|uniref:uncharacterized protein LOC142235744 n=1 Tax=Haematobia irritans TaxID=7368 RepID=UPI003F505744
MIYNRIKQKNVSIKKKINRHKNLKVKIEKIHSSITFLIKCRNNGIIPDFVKNAMKNMYTILENIHVTKNNLQTTLLTYIEHFQRKILNILIKHQHNLLKTYTEDETNIQKWLNQRLTREESTELWTTEEEKLKKIKEKSKEVHRIKFENLRKKQLAELDIRINEKWFINKTKTEFPDDIKWLLSMGQKFGLPTQKSDFPIFKYIADGENLIQTNNNKEEQETARIKFATTVDNHMNKMSQNGRDIFIMNTGNTTVAMEKEDYKNRMRQIVDDMMSYQRINKDPTQSLQKKNNELVEELFRNKVLSEFEMRRLKTEIATAPRLYGLPKIHKEDFPLRPICSSINAPAANMNKYLVNILKNLTKESTYNCASRSRYKNHSR